MSEPIKDQAVQEAVERLLEQLNPDAKERAGAIIIDTVHKRVPGWASRSRSMEIKGKIEVVPEDIKKTFNKDAGIDRGQPLGADVFSNDTNLIVGNVSMDFVSIVGAVIKKVADGQYTLQFRYVSNEDFQVLGRTLKASKLVTTVAQDRSDAIRIIERLRTQHVNVLDFTGGDFTEPSSASVKKPQAPS
jgi:hypothetical protein